MKPLPVPVFPGGVSLRDHAIQQAQAWMQEVALANTPIPSLEYLIVRDLLREVFAGERKPYRRRT